MFTSTRSLRIPALFTRTWRSPKVSTAVCTRRCAPSQSATLSTFATASPPIARISSTTTCAAARSAPEPSTFPPRSFTTTFAPSDAKRSACSRPRPPPAPVIIATRPSSAPICILPNDCRSHLCWRPSLNLWRLGLRPERAHNAEATREELPRRRALPWRHA
ncbi:unannotated protein [freshwater metagenome]|uniref:Unannotated protein n=1 Tax=freshwater metagenome TaxID=449393 RepID=A0A6J7DX35_9ZZZZ